MSDRAWLFLPATQSGLHPAGTEAQLAMAAPDYLAALASVDKQRIEIIGAGTGAWPAQYAAALDSRFRRVTLQVPSGSAYTWPEHRMIWRRGTAFPDPGAERLIPPRKVVPIRDAPAAWDPLTAPWPQVRRAYLAQFRQWEAWYRNAALEPYAARETPSLEQYLEQTGRFPATQGPLDAVSKLIYQTGEVDGYRVRVRIYEGVHATGILLIPKSLDRARRHPLVFVPHGLGGLPEDALGVDGRGRQDEVYRKFGLQIARRGYLVFAPMISTQSGDERTELVRRAHPAGLTPTGMERVKFSRLLDSSRPCRSSTPRASASTDSPTATTRLYGPRRACPASARSCRPATSTTGLPGPPIPRSALLTSSTRIISTCTTTACSRDSATPDWPR